MKIDSHLFDGLSYEFVIVTLFLVWIGLTVACWISQLNHAAKSTFSYGKLALDENKSVKGKARYCYTSHAVGFGSYYIISSILLSITILQIAVRNHNTI